MPRIGDKGRSRRQAGAHHPGEAAGDGRRQPGTADGERVGGVCGPAKSPRAAASPARRYGRCCLLGAVVRGTARGTLHFPVPVPGKRGPDAEGTGDRTGWGRGEAGGGRRPAGGKIGRVHVVPCSGPPQSHRPQKHGSPVFVKKRAFCAGGTGNLLFFPGVHLTDVFLCVRCWDFANSNGYCLASRSGFGFVFFF